MNTSEAFLVVGLGNPGREYRLTRHNIGFMLLDRLAGSLNVRFSRFQSRALVASSLYNERRIILAKPQTFMNLSGQSVHGLMRFHKLPLERVIIVHDDLDLPVGTIRIRPDGGAAGQKGMRSIIDRLGTDDFPRLRLGIGRPPGSLPPPDYVLQDFSRSELDALAPTLDLAVKAVLTWVEEGLDAAMNRFNGNML